MIFVNFLFCMCKKKDKNIKFYLNILYKIEKKLKIDKIYSQWNKQKITDYNK